MIFLFITLASLALIWPCFWLLFSPWAAVTAKEAPYHPLYCIVGVVGVFVDVWVNIFIGTPLFWQWPHYKRLLLSARMDDLILYGSGWRKRLAILIVGVLLEPFDKTGQHTTHGN